MTMKTEMRDPEDARDVPSQPRDALWRACYAAAFTAEYFAMRTVLPTFTIDRFVKNNAVCTAEFATTFADVAVWALLEWNKEE